MLDELKKEKNTIDSEELVRVKSDGTIFNFNSFKNSLEFAWNIYHKGKTSLEDAKDAQYRMASLLNNLKNCDQKNSDKIKSRKETIINAERLYNNRNNVIKVFENGVFPLTLDFKKKSQARLIKHFQTG